MEVRIIGGGIVGLSIAWRLAQRGVKVAVYDKGLVAAEASWAGAGMLSPGGEFRADSPWTRRAIESLELFSPFVEELRAETGMAIDFHVCGAVELDRDDAPAPGIAWQLLTALEAAERAPVRTTAAARWFAGEAQADPRSICRALAEACRMRGVAIHENTAVGDGAAPCVIAAGAWASRLRAGIPQSYPVRGTLLGYQLEPGALPCIVRRGHYYALQRQSGFTIFGSDHVPDVWTYTPEPGSVNLLRRAAAELLPTLLDRAPDEVWTGLRPASVAADPVVEKLPGENTWLAYGHFRNGILLAPVTARMIADSVMSTLGKG
jgi:glycine oxidase